MDEKSTEDGGGGEHIGSADDVGDGFGGYWVCGEEGCSEKRDPKMARETEHQKIEQEGVEEMDAEVDPVKADDLLARGGVVAVAEIAPVKPIGEGGDRAEESADSFRPPVILHKDVANAGRFALIFPSGRFGHVEFDDVFVVEDPFGLEGVAVGDENEQEEDQAGDQVPFHADAEERLDLEGQRGRLGLFDFWTGAGVERNRGGGISTGEDGDDGFAWHIED